MSPKVRVPRRQNKSRRGEAWSTPAPPDRRGDDHGRATRPRCCPGGSTTTPGQVGLDNLVVLDDNSSDGSTEGLGCTVHRLPSLSGKGFESARMQLLSGLAGGFLARRTTSWSSSTSTSSWCPTRPGTPTCRLPRRLVRIVRSWRRSPSTWSTCPPSRAPAGGRTGPGPAPVRQVRPVMCKPSIKRVAARWRLGLARHRGAVRGRPRALHAPPEVRRPRPAPAGGGAPQGARGRRRPGQGSSWSREADDIVAALDRAVAGVDVTRCPEFDPREVDLTTIVEPREGWHRAVGAGQVQALRQVPFAGAVLPVVPEPMVGTQRPRRAPSRIAARAAPERRPQGRRGPGPVRTSVAPTVAGQATIRAARPLYVFVVTYGRSGSTLVQGLLNTLPRTSCAGRTASTCCSCSARGQGAGLPRPAPQAHPPEGELRLLRAHAAPAESFVAAPASLVTGTSSVSVDRRGRRARVQGGAVARVQPDETGASSPSSTSVPRLRASSSTSVSTRVVGSGFWQAHDTARCSPRSGGWRRSRTSCAADPGGAGARPALRAGDQRGPGEVRRPAAGARRVRPRVCDEALIAACARPWTRDTARSRSVPAVPAAGAAARRRSRTARPEARQPPPG